MEMTRKMPTTVTTSNNRKKRTKKRIKRKRKKSEMPSVAHAVLTSSSLLARADYVWVYAENVYAWLTDQCRKVFHFFPLSRQTHENDNELSGCEMSLVQELTKKKKKTKKISGEKNIKMTFFVFSGKKTQSVHVLRCYRLRPHGKRQTKSKLENDKSKRTRKKKCGDSTKNVLKGRRFS